MLFDHPMLFDGWSGAGRVLATGAAAYITMVIALRLSGKRTLAKLNAFDLIVTVALGSVLATIALSRVVSFIEGIAAIVVLVGAQWVVSWLSVHTSQMRGLVRAEATVVFRDGTFDDEAMGAVRLTRDEVTQSIRSSGFGDLEAVAAVVLENDGSLSVIGADSCRTASALPSPTAGGHVNHTPPTTPPPKGVHS